MSKRNVSGENSNVTKKQKKENGDSSGSSEKYESLSHEELLVVTKKNAKERKEALKKAEEEKEALKTVLLKVEEEKKTLKTAAEEALKRASKAEVEKAEALKKALEQAEENKKVVDEMKKKIVAMVASMYPPIQSSVSKMTREKAKKLVERRTLIEMPFYMDLCRFLNGDGDVFDQARKAGVDAWGMIRKERQPKKRTNHLFGALGCGNLELAYTAILQGSISAHSGQSLELLWAHQLPAAAASCPDVTLHVNSKQGYIPCLVMEVAMERKDKNPQLIGYACNLFAQIPFLSQILIGVEISDIGSNHAPVHVRAYNIPNCLFTKKITKPRSPISKAHPNDDDDDDDDNKEDEENKQAKSNTKVTKNGEDGDELKSEKGRGYLGETLLWSGKLSAESLGRIVHVGTLAARYNLEQHDKKKWVVLGQNVAYNKENNKIYKCYNHRSKKKKNKNRLRTWVRYQEVAEVTGFTTEIASGDVHVISYDFLPHLSANENITVKHLIAVCQHLQRVHNRNIVHGDIKLSNIVFAVKPEDSRLIDFDLSGEPAKTKYPRNYSGRIETEGKRHENAKPGKSLQMNHDLYSLSESFKKLLPATPDKKWVTIFESINSGLKEAIAKMRKEKEQNFQHPKPEAIFDPNASVERPFGTQSQ